MCVCLSYYILELSSVSYSQYTLDVFGSKRPCKEKGFEQTISILLDRPFARSGKKKNRKRECLFLSLTPPPPLLLHPPNAVLGPINPLLLNQGEKNQKPFGKSKAMSGKRK